MKKFLSLVLALVMTMSLVTVSAGATDFGDDDEINYKEAVDVMSALEIIDGYTDGDFRPDGTLTRGAAAKIIACMMLGKTTAESLGTQAAPFRDVPVGSTFAGYIAYCVEAGIIDGYADGTFRPSAGLTGYAFLKMLLTAMGYDSSIERFTGSNWTVNVARRAIENGLTDGNDEFIGTQLATREEACLYAFNTLQATLVEYENRGSTITINGIEVVQGASTPSYVTSNVYDAATSIDATKDNATGDYTVEFAEKYQPRLVLAASVDDFSRPANVWTYKGVEVGTYPKTADATYTANVTLGTIYADLNMSQKDEDVQVYVDGLKADEEAEVSRNNDLKLSEVVYDQTKGQTDALRYCQIGNGTLVEAFRNENTNQVTIVAINTYAAEVNRVVAASGNKPAYITLTEMITEKDGDGLGTVSGVQVNDEYEAEGFATDDVVLFTYSKSAKEIKSVVAAESVTGELTKWVNGKTVDLGENSYNYSNKYSVDTGEDSLNIGSSYEVYLDAYGYAIYMVETEYNIQDYAFLRALESGNTAFGSNRASLWDYKGDGRTVTLNRDYIAEGGAEFDRYPNGAGSPAEATIGYKGATGVDDAAIVLVRETSNGSYRLQALNTYNYDNVSDDVVMRNGVARISLEGNTYYADDRTQVVVRLTDSSDPTFGTRWYSYTGANSMPTITEKTPLVTPTNPLKASVYCRNGSVVTIMYIDVDQADFSYVAGNNDVIFVSPHSASNRTEDGDNVYYSYQAVVNGNITTVKVEANMLPWYNQYPAFYTTGVNSGKLVTATDDLAFTNIAYDDDVIIDWDDVLDGGVDGGSGDGASIALGVNKLSNGNLQLGYDSGNRTYGTVGTFVVASDVKVYFIDDDGDITEGTMSGVRRSNEDIVTYVLKDGQITHLFVQQYWDDKNSNTPQTPAVLVGSIAVTASDGMPLQAVLRDNSGTPISTGAYTVNVSAIRDGVRVDLGSYTVSPSAGLIAINSVICASGWSYTVTSGNAFGSDTAT